jgi:hypothetical protein
MAVARTVDSKVSRHGLIIACTAAVAAISSPASAIESRTYVMSSFWHAMNTTPQDCPTGINPKIKEQYELNLAALGYSARDIATMMEGFVEGERGGWEKDRLGQAMHYRGRIDGKPVNGFVHPYSTVDPKLKGSEGKYAYGFNLDGAVAADDQEDPISHEKGVDHALARALGCIEPMRGTLREGTAFWQFMWTAIKSIAPAWTVTISGEDLSKDGPVIVSIGRAMEPPRYNGNGTPRASMTFRADLDPRVNKNIYKATKQGNIISIVEHGPYRNLSDALLFPRFELDNFHARLTLNDDGSLEGIIGGYQTVESLYFAIGNGNLAAETSYAPEIPGMYHLMRRYADANPVDGKNMSISAAYYFHSVPAFIVPPKQVLATR